MILTAQYARENRVPYFGICLGMQIAVIEFARNVAKIKNANSGEFAQDVPKVIDFSETNAYENGIWYTLTGINLGENRPATPGVYLFNGQRVMIK